MAEDPTRSPLQRRLLVLRLAALGGASALPGAALAQGAKSGGPGRPTQQRSGLTDSDPTDEPGNGRTGNRTQGGVTDSDPSDQPGQGRGGNQPQQGGVTDSDPSDPPGQGRGGNRPQQPAGPTDTDPTDPPGRGRGRSGDLKST